MAHPVLELRQLRRVFPGYELGPISLRFDQGSIYGLLGPNGTGKTTLFNLIALQLKPTAGNLLSNGCPIRWREREWTTRLSYIRERPTFYDALTITQTLHLASQLYGNWDTALAERLVRHFQLDPYRPIGRLSKGSQVQIGLITALAHRAELLLLDEPTAGLDPTARRELLQTIRQLLLDQTTRCVIFSSHIFEDLEEIATDLIVLRRGRVAFRANANTLRSSVLYRTDTAPLLRTLTGTLLQWHRHGSTWTLVRRESSADVRLRLNPAHVTEHPTNLFSVVYDGTEHTHAG